MTHLFIKLTCWSKHSMHSRGPNRRGDCKHSTLDFGFYSPMAMSHFSKLRNTICCICHLQLSQEVTSLMQHSVRWESSPEPRSELSVATHVKHAAPQQRWLLRSRCNHLCWGEIGRAHV